MIQDSIIGAYLETVGESTPQAQAIMGILKSGDSGRPIAPAAAPGTHIWQLPVSSKILQSFI